MYLTVVRALTVCLVSALCSLGQVTAKLQTVQTVLEVQAGPTSPRVLSLTTGHDTVFVNSVPEPLVDHLSMDGRSVSVRWQFDPSASQITATKVRFVYRSVSPRLRLTWSWRVPVSTGPIEHTVDIENLESAELWIPMQDSLTLQYAVKSATVLRHFFVEKGAGRPSAIGTHDVSLPVGYRWTGESSTYAHPAADEPREIIPFSAVQDASETGWYVGIEFSGRTRLSLERDAASLRSIVGLNPEPGPVRTRLRPHETFAAPTIFLGAFTNGVDGLGNVLRPWIRRVLGNPRTWRNPNYPWLVNNSWGSGMQVDEQLARRMIRDSAELGLEMFHVDAGWFRAVGDWYPDPNKFPHGLAAIADDAHAHGLRFGIWTDWTQAGLSRQSGALNLKDPAVHDWTVSDLPAGWKPAEFKGQTIDIGVPAAQDYARREVSRIVNDYRLDMLEHDGYLVAQGCVRDDHPHAPPDRSRMFVTKTDGSYFVKSCNSTDVSYHAVHAYYDIYEALRKLHPGLLLEICNDGGRMVDFGSAAHGDYFSITDSYDPVSNRQAFYDASHVLPTAMLEAYVEKWPAPTIENFRYMLRSGMMGWLTLMLDTTAWSAQERIAAIREIQIYKKELRPLIRDADLYHGGPRPDGVHWDGIEYFDPARQRGVVYAFRGSALGEDSHVFRVRGVTSDKRFRLRFADHSSADRLIAGRELLRQGVTVRLTQPNSSELIFIDELASGQ